MSGRVTAGGGARSDRRSVFCVFSGDILTQTCWWFFGHKMCHGPFLATPKTSMLSLNYTLSIWGEHFFEKICAEGPYGVSGQLSNPGHETFLPNKRWLEDLE